MHSTPAGPPAAARTRPLAVLVLLLAVLTVHGVHGALIHGHTHAGAPHAAGLAHAGGDGTLHGVHSLTLAVDHGQHSSHHGGAACAQDGDSGGARPHEHADTVTVAGSGGQPSPAASPAPLAIAPVGLIPPRPRAPAVHARLRFRRRRWRMRRTRVRLAELSVLQV